MPADVTELLPLKGYQSSVAIDANEDGQVVGFSADPGLPAPATMRATLWDAAGEPLSLSASTSNSAAFRINNKGEVLLAEGFSAEYAPFVHGGFHWTPASAYHLWREDQPLVNLTDAGVAAVDLNDLDQVLLRNPDGTAAITYVSAGTTKDLPQPPPDVSAYTHRQYLGIDNAGRVACWVFHWGPGPAIDAILSQAWRLDPEGTEWVREEPSGQTLAWWRVNENASYPPRLARSGLMLANATEYWDLNQIPATRKVIPAKPKRIGVYRNASPNGQRMVGLEADSDYQPGQPFLWNNAVATYYEPGAVTATSLAGDLPGVDSSIAVAATDGGLIVGNGAVGQRVRGWTLSYVKGPQRIMTTEQQIHPMAIVAHELFLTLTLPDPAPWDAFRARVWKQLQAMSPQERKAALARLGKLADSVRLLENESR